jgi:signal transduction protein with GAF and PtsI domain
MKDNGWNFFVALYGVARVVNASLEPARVLEEIVRCVAETMNVKACSLRLLDSRREKLLMGAAFGLSRQYMAKGPVLVSESGLDQKALKGRSVWIEDARSDRDFQYGSMAKTEGIRSLLVVPLMHEGKALGVLRVYTDKIRKFTSQEIQFLEASANLSAIAIDNARLHKSLQTRCDLMAAHKYRIDDN